MTTEQNSSDAVSRNNAHQHWSSIREAGTLFGLQFLGFIHKVFGRWPVTLCLIPTVAYFVIFKKGARRASQEYLHNHFKTFPWQWPKKPNLWSTCRHLFVFAETVVDKLLSWTVEIDSENFVIDHPERIEALMADQRGQLIIGSHMGNLEYCRGFMHRYKNKSINILVHDQHSQNYNTIMQQLNPDSRLNVFQVSEFDIPTMLSIKAKIDAGEWVFIAGDRSPLSGTGRTVEVDFLSQTAQLPIGPYMLAKGLGCPVKLMFSYCDYFSKEKAVHFEVVDFTDKVVFDRKQRQKQIQEYAQRFADELAEQCKNAPYQWFNFYDFWAEQTVS